MKKVLKALLIIILLIVILLFTIPMLFKGQLLTLVQNEINENVNANLEFADFNVSLIRNFPSLTISLQELKVNGIGKFEGNTLIAFNSFDITVDLGSVLKKDIKVTRIILDHPVINGIVLEDGSANWNIARAYDSVEKTAEEVADTTDFSEMDYKIALKKFEIIDARISYNDKKAGINADIGSLNYSLSGNLALDFTNILTELDIKDIDVTMGGINYMKKAHFHFLADVDADLKNQIFTLKNNELTLNDLTLILKGKAIMMGKNIDLDISFETNKADLKGLLSMIPSIYMKDFEEIQTDGKIQLNGTVKGLLANKQIPEATLNLNIENGMFKYPDLPKAIDNLNVGINVNYNGVDNDKTTIDVNKFHFEFGENHFDLGLNLKTPVSDPQIEALLKGTIDLASLADVIPMEETSLSGILTINLEAMGKMSTIEQEKYEEFNALGNVQLAGFEFNSPSVQKPVSIENMELVFSPKFVNLSSFDAKIGESDLHLNGNLENFIPYALSDGILKGELNFSSNYINVNELIPEPTTEKAPATEQKVASADTITSTDGIEIPGNIDFTLITSIDKVLYDKMDITNIQGNIAIKNKKAMLENLSMNTLDGDMIMSGEFNTQDKMTPKVTFMLDVNNVDIQKAPNSLSIIDSLVPTAKDYYGKVSLELQFKSILDDQMSPVLSSINGAGKIQTKEIRIGDKTFNKIADTFKNDKLRTVGISDIDAEFSIVDGKVKLHPFGKKFNNLKTDERGSLRPGRALNYKINKESPEKRPENEVD